MTQEATIRRGVRNARYSAIPNHVFEDDRLSMEARWLLSYLLSKPDHWTVVIGDIVKRGNCGRDKARKMIAELVECGYAEREQQRADGKFGSSVLVIFDEPKGEETPESKANSESVAFLPQTDLPATAKPAPVLPSPVKSAHSNNSDSVNTDFEKREGAGETENQESPQAIERKFKRWYPTYPGYDYASEFAARQEWTSLCDAERAECIERTPAYVAAGKAAKAKFVFPSVYLKERKWRQMDDPKSEFAPATMHNPFSRAWMAQRLAELSKPMSMTGWPALTGFQTAQSRDAELARQIERERKSKYGWPKVHEMHSRAERSVGVTVPGPILSLSEGFEKVHRDSAAAGRWRNLHDRMGWPWLPMTGHEWLYFPAGEPEEAMADFQKRLIEGKGDVDAA